VLHNTRRSGWPSRKGLQATTDTRLGQAARGLRVSGADVVRRFVAAGHDAVRRCVQERSDALPAFYATQRHDRPSRKCTHLGGTPPQTDVMATERPTAVSNNSSGEQISRTSQSLQPTNKLHSD
jgi:hypothetical protein